ncbi:MULTISPECIES: SufE family protein [unclassified Vibrio]|uniref:SufE family protein n=1 Tax=Vibrio sp. HB236076 TaxID=3232307 RepID=A0AB39HGV1_9VIBR|nr:SufE family protein [Vibrio sp. HB161653]MDP5254899.1 SufE family protein [Vibrio sp. HB161653]
MNSARPTLSQVIDTMQSMQGWENKYRQVIVWGKSLPTMSEQDKQASLAVAGCESQVWLTVTAQSGGTWWIQADSNARIVRGLIFVILVAYQGKSSADILAFDTEAYFAQLGLLSHLSPSRGNGLRAIVETIRQQVSGAH